MVVTCWRRGLSGGGGDDDWLLVCEVLRARLVSGGGYARLGCFVLY